MMNRLKCPYLTPQHFKVNLTPFPLSERSLVYDFHGTEDVCCHVFRSTHLPKITDTNALIYLVIMSDVMLFQFLDRHSARVIHQSSDFLLTFHVIRRLTKLLLIIVLFLVSIWQVGL